MKSNGLQTTSLNNKSPSTFEVFADSDFTKSITRTLAQIFSLVLLLIPAVLRKPMLRLISFVRAKVLLSRLGLRSISKETEKIYQYGTIDNEVITIDGVKLKTTHFFPHGDKDEKRPCIIFRTPYFRYFDFSFALHFVHRGYHVLLQDVRGRFESSGKYTLNEFEMQDSNCTLRWISQQPWSDKTVGVIGLSMGGYTSWNVYASTFKNSDNHGVTVKAIVPAISSSNLLLNGTYFKRDDEEKDPVLNLDLITKYTRLTYELGKSQTLFGSYMLWVIYKFSQLGYQYCSDEWAAKIKHLPLKDIDLVITEDIPSPRKELSTDAHTRYNCLNLSWAVEKLGAGEGETPAFGCFISGWYDIYGRATINDFKLARKHEKKAGLASKSLEGSANRLQLIIGDYSHFDDYFVVITRSAMRCFDAAFFGDKILYPPMKRVLVVCLGSEGYFRQHRPILEQLRCMLYPSSFAHSLANESHSCWRQFEEWPPEESREQTLTLCASRMLLPTQYCDLSTIDKADSNSFVWNPYEPTPSHGGVLFSLYAGAVDQTHIINRADTIYYASPKINSAFEIAGNVSFSCWVRSSAKSMDVVAMLCVETPTKKPKVFNLCEGIDRVRLKDGEQWPKRARVDLGPICAQFAKGSKIGLLLSGGSFPKFSRNLGFGEDFTTAKKMTSAKHTIFWKDSKLALPTINEVGGQKVYKDFDVSDILEESHNHIVSMVLAEKKQQPINVV